MNEVKLYAERDLMEMDRAGNHYCRHVDHMTREKLHSKSDIAAELGWRDMQIANLKEQLSATTNSLTNVQEALKSAGIEADTVQAGVMELVSRMNQAVAENAALKDINAWCQTHAFENMYREFKTAEAIGCPDVDCMHDAMLTAIMHAPETPATDAYLNAVRMDFLPAGLHTSTSELVLTFAKALAEKLHRSERKYGWSDGWKDVGWQDKCLADFHHHISKGDPRDVAAYCAFMWYHDWPTRPAPAIDLNAVRAEGADLCVKALVTSDDDDFSDAPNICSMVSAKLRAGNAGKDGSHE